MHLVLLVLTVIIHHINTETIECGAKEDCTCIQNNDCIINCIGKDQCKDATVTLTCKANQPCTVNCIGIASCGDAAVIGTDATDVTVTCDGRDACKGSGELQCGTGHCHLICIDGVGSACQNIYISTNNAHSFQCTGYCPPPIPLSYSASPTSEPTNNPTLEPITTGIPTIDPTLEPTLSTNDPTSVPTLEPTINPHTDPTVEPTLIPTYNPTKTPSNSPTHSTPSPTPLPTTLSPTDNPTTSPTGNPTPAPTTQPTTAPTNNPTSSPTNLPTPKPTFRPSFAPTKIPTDDPTKLPTNSPLHGCSSALLLDLVIILDSSGSVYDSDYNNWQAELDFAKAIINSTLPSQSRVSLINFSGCVPSFTMETCMEQNKLKKMFGFTDYNLSVAYDKINEMGDADFNGGYTWTNEALIMALHEFTYNSTAERTKMIVLVTDGEPYPPAATPPHEPCMQSNGYISPTLHQLRAMNVTMLAVGIDVVQSTIDDFFTCVLQDFDSQFFFCPTFSNLTQIVNDIKPLICIPQTPNPTTFPSKHPSTNPSKFPAITTDAVTMIPTQNPVTMVPTTRPIQKRRWYIFRCLYNDENSNYYAFYMTLYKYAELMRNATFSAIESTTFYSANYNQTQINPRSAWKKGGIYNFKICIIFSDITIPDGSDDCANLEYNSDDSDDESKAEFTAVGIFGIVADEALDEYEQFLIDAMISNKFKKEFSREMNSALNSVTNERRRNLLANKFQTILIQVIIPQNDSIINTNSPADRQTVTNNVSSRTAILLSIIAILLLIVIGIVLFIYKKFYKIGNEKEEKEEMEELEEGAISEKVEMLEMEHNDSEVMEAMNKPAMMEENVDDESNYNVFVGCNRDNIEKCEIIRRLLGIMISYETWNELSDGASKWNLIKSLFEDCDLMDLIDDYNHYLSDHDNTESLDYVTKYILSRIHNECNKKHDIGNGRKHLMDSQHFDVSSEDIFKLEMVDKIHLYFFHKNNKKKEKRKEKIALPQTDTFAMVLGENELDNILELEQDENKNNLLELEIIKEINRTVIGHEDDNYDIDEMDVAHIDISDILDTVNNAQLQDVEIDPRNNNDDNEDIVLPAHETNTINAGEMHPLFSM